MATDEIPDYYTEFGIARSATANEISHELDRAFRLWSNRASRAPDQRNRREAEDKVELISEARSELRDPARRDAYDRRLDQMRQCPGSEELPPGRQQPTQGGRDWVGHARTLMDQGNWEAALYELRQAVHHDDGNGTAWRLLGVIHTNQGQLSDALQEFHRALALYPGDALTHTLIAKVHEQLGNQFNAANWHLEAARLAPDDIDSRVTAANSLYQAGRFDEALNNYEQLLVKRPDQDMIRDRIGRIWSLRAQGAMAWHPMKQRYVVASETGASMVMHCVDQALAVGISDAELFHQLTAYRADAGKALTKTWRWHKSMAAVMAACFVLMLVPGETLNLLALAGFFLLPITMGIKPRWRHTYIGLPPNQRPQARRIP